jgi:hypothetical protein
MVPPQTWFINRINVGQRKRKQYLEALKDTLSFVLIHELVHLYSGVLHDTKIDGLTRILAQLIY